VKDYVALLFYRHRLHKEWLFFEISPQLHFPVEKSIKARLRLTDARCSTQDVTDSTKTIFKRFTRWGVLRAMGSMNLRKHDFLAMQQSPTWRTEIY